MLCWEGFWSLMWTGVGERGEEWLEWLVMTDSWWLISDVCHRHGEEKEATVLRSHTMWTFWAAHPFLSSLRMLLSSQIRWIPSCPLEPLRSVTATLFYCWASLWSQLLLGTESSSVSNEYWPLSQVHGAVSQWDETILRTLSPYQTAWHRTV